MKDQKFQNIIFDEEGEAVTRQQLLDSYYEGTNETKNRDYNVNDEQK